jgi:hypothetical protein
VTLVPLTPRSARFVAEPLTTPLPRLADVVHAVTATFGPSGWTLRFGPAGREAVVARLADADADGAARRLVGSVLGVPAETVRIRITPDRATLDALRRP